MKALIPAAGMGTRLRPHTLNKPKALLPVAGKPILGHIVDDLLEAGIEGFVIIIGFCGGSVREWFHKEYPEVDVTFVEQAEMLGLGHALWTAREAIGDNPFFCILGDTILKADYASLLAAEDNCIAVREVDDPRRFGVVRMDGDSIAEFVEKPEIPPSNLAIVGAYLIRDASALWNAMTDIIENNKRNRGEFQLTDGLQDMLAQGIKFSIAPIEDWYDCGAKETWIETNRVLLEGSKSGDYSQCSIASDVEIVDSKIGAFVSISAGAVIRNCELSDCVIGPNAKVIDSKLSDSLVGESALVSNYTGSVNIGDWCELESGSTKEQK